MVCPGLRYVLASRVGKEVAVVEINHQACLGIGLHRPFCKEYHILLTAPASIWIHPYAKPDSVLLFPEHKVHDVLGAAGSVLPGLSVMLHLGCPADVGADNEGGFGVRVVSVAVVFVVAVVVLIVVLIVLPVSVAACAAFAFAGCCHHGAGQCRKYDSYAVSHCKWVV